jgi:hypothetical protein
MPEVTSYVSANGKYRLTVVPRKLESQLAYFQTKSRGETLPRSKGPLGRVEELRDGKWLPLWSRPLVNEVAPVTAVVADDGRHVVTFDNWHMTGFGEHVVVIYGAGGALIRSLRLDEIVPAYFVDALPRSVSSIHWRSGEPRFIGEILEVRVSEPRDQLSEEGGIAVRIVLSDGSVEQIPPQKFAELRKHICALHANSVRQFNESLAYERSALAYPASGDEGDWQRYLHHAVERLRPREAPAEGESESDPFAGIFGETPFELLEAGAYMDEDFRNSFRDALTAPVKELRRRWFASRDQERMVAEVERTAKKIKPGQLSGVDMRFFADDAHWPRIRDALAASGAQLIQIDISAPIPPRSEDIAGLPPERTLDPACAAAVEDG